jgi:integrase/recombinase XerC
MLTDDHLDHLRLKGHTAASVYARKRALIRLQSALPVPLLDATPAMLAEWRASLTVGDQSVVSYVSHAKSFYAFCVAEGLRPDNPAVNLPVPRLGRRVPRPVAEDALMEALAAAPRRIRLMIVLAAWCGLRAKELALLRRQCILDTAVPPVLLVEAAAAKGGRTERIVPLSPFLLDELRAASLPLSGYVFRRMDGRPGANAPWRISQICNRHLHRCGLGDTLHSLRHRYGTQVYRASGHDLRLTQELLGHQNPSTTAGYAAYDRAGAAEAVEAIPAPARLRVAR